MTNSIAYRGPDDQGFFDNEYVSLGQRRLSIVDIIGGHQPISDDTSTLVLVVNGEIYNSPQLRKQFEKNGYPFKTNSDSEVILPLYQKYGVDCVRHLRGMFAIVIWDKTEKSLFFARDHLGQKPIFFTFRDNSLRLASEVKALLEIQNTTPEIDLNCLWHYISLRFVPDDLTFFKGIHKLKAGHWGLWKNGKLETRKYWDVDFTKKITGTFSEVEEQLHEKLLETVQSHLLSDVPVGAFLSGGIDSSLVSAMMASLGHEKLPVFSIGVEEVGFNELPWARKVVEKYGMTAHEKVVNANLIKLIPRMIHHMDEPSDPFGVGVFLVSQLASNHVKVVLTGDGGDENFAGYDRFEGQRWAELYSMMPKWLRQQVMARLIKCIPDSFAYKSISQKLQWLHNMSFHQSGNRYVHSLTFLRFSQEAKMELFTDNVISQIEDRNSADKILHYFDASNVDDLIDKMLYSDLMTRLPDHLLMIEDRMTMAHSLESRSPLVDPQIVEFAAKIPVGMKIKGRELKSILRSTASRYLPRELIYREKQGFGFPLANWMRGELSDLLRNVFSDSRFVSLGIFNVESINKYLNEHLSGKADHNFRLWILLNLEIWYRIYFDKMSQNEIDEWLEELMEG